MAVDPAGSQLLAQVLVGGDILHGQGRHGLIVIEDLRDEGGSQGGLQLQRLGLDLVAVDIQWAAGRAQELVRLLDDHRAAVFARTHLKNVVDISVADLTALGLLFRIKAVQHFHHITLYILGLHQKKGIEIRHMFLLPIHPSGQPGG